MAADVVFVVDNGMDITTDLLLETPLVGASPHWIDWGTDDTVATDTDETMGTPGGEARTVGVSTQETTTVTHDTLQVVGTMTEGGGGAAIVECGLFNSLAGTTNFMFLHATFDVINLVDTNSIEFTIRVKFDQG